MRSDSITVGEIANFFLTNYHDVSFSSFTFEYVAPFPCQNVTQNHFSDFASGFRSTWASNSPGLLDQLLVLQRLQFDFLAPIFQIARRHHDGLQLHALHLQLALQTLQLLIRVSSCNILSWKLVVLAHFF